MTTRRRLGAALAVSALLSMSAGARAQAVDDATRAAARELGTAGVQAYQAGDYETASEKLEKAYRVLKAPSLGLWSARALVKQRRLVQAAERYLEVTRLSPSSGDVKVQKQALVDAEKELAELEPTIPAVVVELQGAAPADVTLSLDGAPVPSELVGEKRRTDPGNHRIEAARGAERRAEEFTVREGEVKAVTLKFVGEAKPPAAGAAEESSASTADSSPGSALPIVGLVTAGAGVVALGVGTYFGLHAKSLNDQSNADGHCTNGCDPTGTKLRNDAGSAADISTALFIGGGALVATGLTLYFVGGSSKSSTTAGVSPLVVRSGAGVSLAGAF
ncbi:MAG TPA: hypothetical protein VF103_06330 [Polyangiaceae bacterium]